MIGAGAARVGTSAAVAVMAELAAAQRDRLMARPARSARALVDRVRFDADGLVPAVVQDAGDGRVLTLAYMNRESLERTLERGRDLVLEPLAPGAVAQGRDQRQHAGGARR